MEVGDRERRVAPSVRAGDELEAANVVRRAVVERDVEGEVVHRACARPVAVVLVPRDRPPATGWLHKELVVEEPNRPVAEELRCDGGDARVEDEVVEEMAHTPMAEAVR